MSTRRAVSWAIDEGDGNELTEIELGERGLGEPGLVARGVSTAREPEPYRLAYDLRTGTDYVTERLTVETRGDRWVRTLDLRRDAGGTWSAGGAHVGPFRDLPELTGAIDCDLGRCPVTNSLPVLRAGLLDRDDSVDIVVAWVSVPDLHVRASRQRYTGLGRSPDGLRLVRFEALGSGFTADVTFDSDGLVVDYPGMARRLGAQR